MDLRVEPFLEQGLRLSDAHGQVWSGRLNLLFERRISADPIGCSPRMAVSAWN